MILYKKSIQNLKKRLKLEHSVFETRFSTELFLSFALFFLNLFSINVSGNFLRGEVIFKANYRNF